MWGVEDARFDLEDVLFDFKSVKLVYESAQLDMKRCIKKVTIIAAWLESPNLCCVHSLLDTDDRLYPPQIISRCLQTHALLNRNCVLELCQSSSQVRVRVRALGKGWTTKAFWWVLIVGRGMGFWMNKSMFDPSNFGNSESSVILWNPNWHAYSEDCPWGLRIVCNCWKSLIEAEAAPSAFSPDVKWSVAASTTEVENFGLNSRLRKWRWVVELPRVTYFCTLSSTTFLRYGLLLLGGDPHLTLRLA